MDWKLNVDVHVAAGDDGMMLVVGGLIRPLSGGELEEILRGKPLKNGRRKQSKEGKKPASKPAAKDAGDKQTAWRKKKAKAGLCQWCPSSKPRKAAPGKRLCKEHAQQASERIADARAQRKAA